MVSAKKKSIFLYVCLCVCVCTRDLKGSAPLQLVILFQKFASNKLFLKVCIFYSFYSFYSLETWCKNYLNKYTASYMHLLKQNTILQFGTVFIPRHSKRVK